MLLQRLKEYAERLELPPTLYNEAPVRYVIELDTSGNPTNREPTDTADPGNPATKRGARRLVPQVQRSSGIKPLLLADNAEYTLGLPKEGSKPERVSGCHDAYLELLRRCASTTSAPEVEAVLHFLDGELASQLLLPGDFDPGATVTFRVGEVFPIDLPSVQAFWAAANDPDADPGHRARVMQCLVCGRERPVLERLQAKIKGVPGGQTSGTSIISANAEAFESYGLTASLIAPTCPECGEKFTKAANALLTDRSSRIVLGGAAFLFWTREKAEFSFLDYLNDPKPEQIRELIDSVRTGKRMPAVDDTAFYATALSGSGGRAVVRDWIDTTIGEVRGHLARWFRMQAIVGGYGEAPQPLSLYQLAVSTVREAKELAPPVPRALLRSALKGTPLPSDLLFQAVRRNRAEQAVSRPRAALIKMVLLGHHRHDREEEMVQLELDNPNPAYRCGRLLAVLERTQQLAIPGITNTVASRFYGAASTAPASVFARLLQGAKPHLTKLERDRPHAAHALQARIEEIAAGIRAFPHILTLEDQGFFALGYYHQRAWDRKQARETRERRTAGQAAQGQETSVETEYAEAAEAVDGTEEF